MLGRFSDNLPKDSLLSGVLVVKVAEMEPMAAEMDWAQRRPATSSDEFVRLYREPIFRLALSITGRPDLAEDVVQETLLRGLKNIRKMQDPLAWLRVAAVRRSMSLLRKHARQEPVAGSPGVSDPLLNLAVRQTLSKLTPEQQTLLALCVGEGWSYAEIGTTLAIPEGTVASRLHAAKEAFRNKWGNER